VTIKRTKAARAADKDQRRAITEEIKELERELPEIPARPRLLIDDVTPEALAEKLSMHGESLGILQAEGGIFDTIGGRYSNGIPNLDIYLKAYSGESCMVDRRGRNAVCLRHLLLTMVISPQPSVVQGFAGTAAFRGHGLVGRFLYVIPESLLGFRDAEPELVPFTAASSWGRLLHSILETPTPTNERNEPARR